MPMHKLVFNTQKERPKEKKSECNSSALLFSRFLHILDGARDLKQKKTKQNNNKIEYNQQTTQKMA